MQSGSHWLTSSAAAKTAPLPPASVIGFLRGAGFLLFYLHRRTKSYPPPHQESALYFRFSGKVSPLQKQLLEDLSSTH